MPHKIYAAISVVLGVIFAAASKDGGAFLIGAVGTFIFLEVYMAPSTVAYDRDKRNLQAIIFLNLALGWTLVGWVVAFVWAVAAEEIKVVAAPQPKRQDERACPYCAELVKAAALKCKHCGSELKPSP